MLHNLPHNTILLISLFFITYLIGSIPFAYLYGKIFKGIDIREHGSKNVGATNTLRVFGVTAGIFVLILDICKGFFPVWFITKTIYGVNTEWLPVAIGVCAILGHTFTIFLKFKGGKGVATSAGVMLALCLVPCLWAILLFAIVVAITRYVSLGSMLAVIALVVMTILSKQNIYIICFVSVLAVFIIYKHKANIGRLIAGNENKIGKKRDNG